MIFMPRYSIGAPFARSGLSVSSMLGETLAALIVLLIVPAAHYGIRPIIMAGAAVLTCAVCEIICGFFQYGKLYVSDVSFAVTGLVIAMLMPLNAPVWLPCAASMAAELAAKIPFGQYGRQPFNPAAAGAAFAALCWPAETFTYFDPSKPFVLPAFGSCTYTAAMSPAAVLKNGLKPDVQPLDMLWGTATGALGTTAVLVIAACGLFLFLRRSANFEITLSFLAACAVIAAFFPRIMCSPLTSVKYEMLSGSLLFCSVFMVTDPATSPGTVVGRCFYGAFAGCMLMVMRHFGAFEQGAFFAVLFANALSPLIDKVSLRTVRVWRQVV